MAVKRPRKVSDRGVLPEALEQYLQVLEGRLPIEKLNELFREDTRWSRDGRSFTEGRDAVIEQISAWRATVEDVTVETKTIQDYEDGCVKIDFYVHSTVEELPVIVGVMAVYMMDGGVLFEMCEFWQAVPPAARDYQ